MPVGPTILWPVKATKSAPSAATSTGSCGTACEASTTTSAPTEWAFAMIASSGLIVPSMLETQVTETTAVCSVISWSMFVEVESTLVGDAEPAQRRTRTLRELLPRDDVGVVLHLRDHDLVVLADATAVTQRAGDQVERLGGVLGEHDLVAAGRADEPGDLVASRLERLAGLAAELMHRPGDIGVVQPVVVVDRPNHALGLL